MNNSLSFFEDGFSVDEVCFYVEDNLVIIPYKGDYKVESWGVVAYISHQQLGEISGKFPSITIKSEE